MAPSSGWVYFKHPDARSYDASQPPASEEFEDAVDFIHDIHRLHQGFSKPADHFGLRFSYNNGTLSIGRDSFERAQNMSKNFYENLYRAISETIYGSNMQEDAGMDLPETQRLVELVLNCKTEPPEIVEFPDSQTFRNAVRSVREARKIPNPDFATVIQARREVIQHAEAMLFLFKTWADRDVILTEEIIQDTHRILCEGLPAEVGSHTTTTGWAGRYRSHNVAAGSTTFTHHVHIEREMKRFVKGFNDDIAHRKTTGELDPFYLAADLAQDFVLIHPFADGNGRMSRLLLNAVLMKYAGVVAPIGTDETDRKEYLRIAQMASELVSIEGGAPGQQTVVEHTDFREEEARCTLARFVMGKAVVQLRNLRNVLGA